jgi:putative RecB family exonuclease
MADVPPVSYSGFRAYAECPLRWKFLYIDDLPEAPRSYFSFGRSMHATLEAFVAPLVPTNGAHGKGPLKRQRTLFDFHGPKGVPPRPMDLPELLQTYQKTWIKEGYASAQEERRYFDLGEDLLTRFHAHYLAAPPFPLAVEEDLEAEVEGLKLHGILDRIDRTPGGGLEVVDYKTSRELSLRDARESDQLSLYQLLVQANYDLPVESLTLYHLRSLTPLRTPARGARDLADLTVRIGEVADGIREEDYEPRPGRHCRFCDFRQLCPEFREVSREDKDRIGALVGRYAEQKRSAEALRKDLESTAAEIHREAERLGLHRLPGPEGTLHRRRQVRWNFPPEQVLPVLQTAGLLPSAAKLDPEEIRRLLHDPRVRADVKRKIAERGSRQVEWSLEFEGNERNGR